MKRTLIFLGVLTLSGTALGLTSTSLADEKQDAIEAADAFNNRQTDLIALAQSLGTLHRLHQVCGDAYNADRFRNRMKELVPLESPMGRTRLDMIAAFNAGYRDASAMYSACDQNTENAYKRVARETLIVTDRLNAPFR